MRGQWHISTLHVLALVLIVFLPMVFVCGIHSVSNRRSFVQSALWHHSPSVSFSSLISSKALFGVESDKFGMLLVC